MRGCSSPDYVLVDKDRRAPNVTGYMYRKGSQAPIAYSTRFWSAERSRWCRASKHFGFWIHDVVHIVTRDGRVMTSPAESPKKWRWFYFNGNLDEEQRMLMYPYKNLTFLRFASAPNRSHDTTTTSTSTGWEVASRIESDKRHWHAKMVPLPDHVRMVTTLLELVLWRNKMRASSNSADNTARKEHRSRARALCGAEVVIPAVLMFL
jgi:hypothetical protein